MNPFSNNRNAMMHQQSYSAEPYREGMDYTDEAWAYGLRALPGSLANQLQALGEYTTGKDYPNKLGNYLNELTQVNEMGYTPQTEYEAGVAFLPELVYDPAIIAGAPYTAYKAARNAPRLLNVLADEAGRTTMRNQLGMLAGPNAKNADLAMLAKAQEMKARGVPTDDIYSETKWWLDHPDGVPRFEIDDSGSYGVGMTQISNPPYRGNVSDYLVHDKAYKNYDHLSSIDAQEVAGNDGSYFSAESPFMDHDAEFIKIGRDQPFSDRRSTTLHELQHAIQSREGMARGGSPSLYSGATSMVENLSKEKELADDVMEYWQRVSTLKMPPKEAMEGLSREAVINARGFENYQQALRWKNSLDEDLNFWAEAAIDPYSKYRALAGEADARLVQNRMNMSMDERLANPFYKGYDVPIEDQIIRFDDGTSMSTKSQLGAVDLPMDEASRMARVLDVDNPEDYSFVAGYMDNPTQYEVRHEIARHNAALPKENGGLGLPQNNTYQDRADILFPVESYHGTNADLYQFDNNHLGRRTGAGSAKQAHFSSDDPYVAGSYVSTNHVFPFAHQDHPKVYADMLSDKAAWSDWLAAGDDVAKQWEVVEKHGYNYGSGSIMPLRLDLGKSRVTDYKGSRYRESTYADEIKKARKGKKDSVVMKNTFDPGWDSYDGDRLATMYAKLSPQGIRSRFAAFDPAKKDSADLLASRLLPIPAGLLGLTTLDPDN